jgi:hypothetical protein
VAVHASMAARRSSLASKSAAELAATAAIGQERRSRLAVLEKEALPLLRGLADGTLDATAADVRDSCARHAAALRHSLTGRPPGASGLAAALEAALETALSAARERGLLVEVQLIGDPGTPPPRLARAVQATVDAVLGALPPQQVTLTVLADSGHPNACDPNDRDPNDHDPNDHDLNKGDLNDGGTSDEDPSGRDSSDEDTDDEDTSDEDTSDEDPKGNDVELFLTFDAPPRGIPELTRFGLDLPAAARWRASVTAADSGGGYLEVSWRKDGAR